MGTFVEYLRLELKRTIKSIPYFLAGAIVLVLLAGTIAFSASKMLYGSQVIGKIKVGVVLPEDDKLATMALSMVSSLDSVESLCEFQYVKEKEGTELLKKGAVFALLKVPEGMVQSIMDGTNTPATVIFSKNAGLEASVFKELTTAGASILATSQAGIYAADEFLLRHGKEMSIPQAEKELNQLFLKYALTRENYFKTQKVSASGDVPVPVFYAISAAVLVLLLLGIPAAPLLKPYGLAMEQKLGLLGIGRWKRTAARTLSMMVLLLLVSVIPFVWCMAKGFILKEPASVLLWLLVCLSASGFILFLYELSGSTTAGILLVFFAATVMLFLSGGFVPGVFLPESLECIGAALPSAFLMDGIKAMVKGGGAIPLTKLVLMEFSVFVLATVIRRDYE